MPERNHAAHVIRESTDRLRELSKIATNPTVAADLVRIARELDGAATALELAYQRDIEATPKTGKSRAPR